MKKKTQLELHYSEENSRRFWEIVNNLKEPYRSTLYALGVALQNLEGQVLKNIFDVANDSVAKKYWFNKLSARFGKERNNS